MARTHLSREMTDMLTQSLSNLLKPERIKTIKVLRSEEDAVSGFVLTNCPTEGQDHWKDFEVHLAEAGSVDYAVVDGRKLTGSAKSGRTTGPRGP